LKVYWYNEEKLAKYIFINKEYQSFSSIKQSRDKIVTCVQWHPTIRGISLSNRIKKKRIFCIM
jgi:hypothetical protein